MTRKEVFVKLNEIFKDVFDDESIHVQEHTTSADIEEWDSLMQINLIVSVEKCFRIKFSMDEIHVMNNVGVMADIILQRI